MFYNTLCAELEKLAVQMNGIHFTRFNSEKPRVRKQLRPIMRDMHDNYPVIKGVRFLTKKTKHAGPVNREVKKSVKNSTNQTTDLLGTRHLHLGGFAAPGSKRVAINMAKGDADFKVPRREIIAHEAFHAKNPILGRSETLAHAYGGWRKTKGAPLGQKVKDATESVKRYRRMKSLGQGYK